MQCPFVLAIITLQLTLVLVKDQRTAQQDLESDDDEHTGALHAKSRRHSLLATSIMENKTTNRYL